MACTGPNRGVYLALHQIYPYAQQYVLEYWTAFLLEKR